MACIILPWQFLRYKACRKFAQHHYFSTLHVYPGLHIIWAWVEPSDILQLQNSTEIVSVRGVFEALQILQCLHKTKTQNFQPNLCNLCTDLKENMRFGMCIWILYFVYCCTRQELVLQTVKHYKYFRLQQLSQCHWDTSCRNNSPM